jgi:catalase
LATGGPVMAQDASAAADQEDAAKALLFLPTNPADGTEASNDPLIQARVDAYAVSFGRRSE